MLPTIGAVPFRIRRDWWKECFCLEVNWPPDLPLQRWAIRYEFPFAQEVFLEAITKLSASYGLNGAEELIELISRRRGNVSIRPGALWSNPPYRGDYFDLPVVIGPFSKFPFGPLPERNPCGLL